MTPEILSRDLKAVLRRLKFGHMLEILAECIPLARQQQMPHPDFLLLVSCPMRPPAETDKTPRSAPSGHTSS